MSNVWFISDTHFGHDNIRQYSNRPFNSIEEMNESLIANWNKYINHSDSVYHLGDFAFGKNDEVKKFRNRLKGKIHLILGNHDYQNKIKRIQDCFTEICDLKSLKINNEVIVLCHYQMKIWEQSHHNSYHLFGHTHSYFPSEGKSMNVGVDLNNYEPISYEEIVRYMKNRPNNINYVG